MRVLFSLILFVSTLQSSAQYLYYDNAPDKSSLGLIYKISAAQTLQFLSWDSIPVDLFIEQIPYRTIPTNVLKDYEPPAGNYVIIHTEDNMLHARLIHRSRYEFYSINNNHRVQVGLLDSLGKNIPKANVWVGKRKARYNKDAGTYSISQINPDEEMVKVYLPGDTCLFELWSLEEMERTRMGQRLYNIKKSVLLRKITSLPHLFINLFKTQSRIYTSGYMLFNQPKYKLTDTVKLKAFLVNKHANPYSKPLDLYFRYYYMGSYKNQKLATVKPDVAGSYQYSFPLSDTLGSDLRYDVCFQRKKKSVYKGNFRTEDYLLDEVAKYEARCDQPSYKLHDTIRVYAFAKNANGLAVLDGKVQLVIEPKNVLQWYKDSIYIPDTLYQKEQALLAECENVFVIPTGLFPLYKGDLQASVIFKNSNNEMQEKYLEIKWNGKYEWLEAEKKGDSLFADYFVDGKSVHATGQTIIYKNFDKKNAISFPLRMKVDPFASGYKIFVEQNGKFTDSVALNFTDEYHLECTRIFQKDSIGFALNNPYEVNVHFSVMDGNRLIANGSDNKPVIDWKQKISNPQKIYRVHWQYHWNGTEQKGQQDIAVLYKILKVDIQAAEQVFPGQKDSVMLTVKDYKNRPAKGVNLSAVSYNQQFGNAIRVNDPPYLAKYHKRPFLQSDDYETDYIGLLEKYPLGKHQAWLRILKIDTMQHYKMLFPKQAVTDFESPLKLMNTELSVHVVKQGKRQEIYMLYINNRLVYYNGVTDRMPYSFDVYPEYTKIAFRLRDSYVEIDSVYMQQFYKHDFVIDLDNLPAKSVRKEKPVYLEPGERNLLEWSLWQLDNNLQTNMSYIWQREKLVYLGNQSKHICGPFTNGDSLHFYAPNRFDIHFKMEKGYEYNLSKKILRLEKKTVFGDMDKVYLPVVANPVWHTGDRISAPPEISYKLPVPDFQLNFDNNFSNFYLTGFFKSTGNCEIRNISDSSWKYIVIVKSFIDTLSYQVSSGSYIKFNRLEAGNYHLLMITKNGSIAQKVICIEKNKTLYYYPTDLVYSKSNLLINSIQQDYAIRKRKEREAKEVEKEITETPVTESKKSVEIISVANYGTCTITGVLLDQYGNLPVTFGTISIKGTQIAVATDARGAFTFSNIKAGRYNLIATAIGYSTKEIVADVFDDVIVAYKIYLIKSNHNLEEVVVTALGIKRESKSLSYSVATISSKDLSIVANPEHMLMGRVPGVQIVSGSGTTIVIRGINSLQANSKPIYIIDGILLDEIPSHIKPEMIMDMAVLDGEKATALYGAKAMNGAIVIATGTKANRRIFKDYASWQPSLTTNKQGQAGFTITYPDNITGWQLFVLAMDGRRRMGKNTHFTKSFKPVMAQLSTPTFLVEGDSSLLTGKLINYTVDDYSLQTRYSINGQLAASNQLMLKSKSSQINILELFATGDTVTTSFGLQTTTGFKDAEERKIPVFKKGMRVASGFFGIANKDTTYHISLSGEAESVTLYAETKSIDFMLNALQSLKYYPWYCMEQTASKLSGLLMEKKIYHSLVKPFKEERTIHKLKEKLLTSQRFEGGWGWWGATPGNAYITNYILQAILPLREDAAIENSMRNGLLYLQNNLNNFQAELLLSSLLTMAKAKHLMDYSPWMKRIVFDSLTLHEQWQFVALKKILKEDFSVQLDSVFVKASHTMPGGLYWGTNTWQWNNNIMATTVLAYEVLHDIPGQESNTAAIRQFLLSSRQGAGWANTVETATILNAILPDLLQEQKNIASGAILNISGDTSFSIKSFPAEIKLSASSKQLQISKSGGESAYITLYEEKWNPNPQLLTEYFDMKTIFYKSGYPVTVLQAGDKVNLVTTVEVKKDAEYVMIEIPVPAGCTYANKNKYNGLHTEYLKDRMVMFAEKINKGIYTYTIELECRYAGQYILNPAKASLMYFPTFYGNNEVQPVQIK